MTRPLTADILLVEDDAGIQELLRFTLEQAGFRIRLTDRAERAIRQKLPLPMDPMPRIMIGGAAVITAAVAVLIMLAEPH